MIELTFFDIHRAEIKKEIIKHTFQDLDNGIVTDVTKISNAEIYIKNYYKSKGYNINKLNAGDTSVENLKVFEDILTKFNISSVGLDKGIPDFIISNDKEFWFIEVKTTDDGLKKNQIDWILRNNLPTMVVFVELIDEANEVL